MLTYLKALLLLPVVVVAILLAIANRSSVLVSLDLSGKADPLLSASVPLYGLILAATALGILIGGAGAWFASGKQRRSGRASRREARRLQGEADRLRASLASGSRALPPPSAAA